MKRRRRAWKNMNSEQFDRALINEISPLKDHPLLTEQDIKTASGVLVNAINKAIDNAML